VTGRLISVVVPTYNGERYLDALLSAVESQVIDAEIDLLVIDSGSTDATLDIVAQHSSVRLVTIPNAEFSHGGTRQLAATLARGSLIAYLTQDAIPLGVTWLSELAAPFSHSDRVALVTGRQHPRTTAFPLQKYEIIGSFAALGPPDATTWSDGADGADPDHERHGFHSDVNAMVRRDLVLGAIPFREVPYSEDMLMARDVLNAGMLKAYAGRAVVEHSNDLTPVEYSRRVFDEVVGMRRIDAAPPPISGRRALIRAVRGSLGDARRIVRDSDFTAATKVRWLIVNPIFQFRKWMSYRRAAVVDLDDELALESRSLERLRRNPSR
jgi:rhamnosyltransferase